MEMAAAFDRAGFSAVDVTMSDLKEGRHQLTDFQGLAACGGFSFGDVLGAGQGWAKSILFEPQMREQFETFFAREEIFALGVCNGCQMMAALKELIPGTQHWPHFAANESGQFESRVIMVEVLQSDSVLFEGMAGTRIPVVVAHGEGRAQFAQDALKTLRAKNQLSLRFVDNYGRTTDRYPFNPNGSTDAVTGLCAADGRVTIMMPHPERNFRTVTNSWHPGDWGEHGPWLRIFQNARAFSG
jgi:phosphoribosylformylglycinamidine synthase